MVYTMILKVDGACRGNGQTGSVAAATAVQLLRSGSHISSTRTLPLDPTPTNQRAELTAIIVALELALEKYKKLKGDPYVDVTIKSDSRYAIDSMNVGLGKWMNNGWVTAAGKDLANVDLLEDALRLDTQLRKEGNIYYVLIPRHQNSLPDRLCKDTLDGCNDKSPSE